MTLEGTRRDAWVAVGCALLVTVLAALSSRFAPPKYSATLIGLMFLGTTRIFVWGKDDNVVETHGLALGGLVIPGTPWRTIRGNALVAIRWALLAALAIFGFYALGFYLYFFKLRGLHARLAMAMPITDILKVAAQDFPGQLLMVALPEEAFYRGFVQTRLARALEGRFDLVAIVLTSAIFAVGHIATIPNPARLAVFFPSLVFGLLRSRTGGIGAGVLFHALCNIYSTALGHAFGLY